jgi:hypothetical protein
LDAGEANSAVPDAEALASAAADGRILLTHNRRHFLHQHRIADHAGIILCTFDPDFADRRSVSTPPFATDPEMTNKLVRVNRPG